MASPTITEDDLSQANKLYKNLATDLNSATECVNTLIEDVSKGMYDTKKGISLLDLKNNTLLMYMCNLAATTLLKLNGKSINGHPVIDRLIELRLVIERLNPYESKLKYQIEKYIQDAQNASNLEAQSSQDDTKGLSVDDFAAGDETDAEKEASDDEEDEGQQFSVSVGDNKVAYKIPKVSQNKFSEDNRFEKEEKAAAARRRLLNSAMMQDALYEHQEDPDVIYNSSSLQRKAIKKREEIRKFEEENLTRLSLSKKEKAAMRTSYTAGTLHGDLLAFSDVAVLDGSAQDGGNKKRKRQSAAKQGKKKGGKKRRKGSK